MDAGNGHTAIASAGETILVRQTDRQGVGTARTLRLVAVLCLSVLLCQTSARLAADEIGGVADLASPLPTDGVMNLVDGRGAFAYDNGAVFARLTFGDVTVDAANSLVNQGYTSRGAILETSLLDGRFSLTAGNTYGLDAPAHQVATPRLDASNRRTAVALNIGVLRTEAIELTMRGDLLDAAHLAQTYFGSDDRLAGEDNTVLGGGFDLSLFGGRLQHSSDFGWSAYARPMSLNALADDLADDTVRHDRAQSHEIEANLWDNGYLSVSAYGLYRVVGPDYRSIEAGPTADRETREWGATLDLGPLSLSFTRTRANDNVESDGDVLTQRWITDSGRLSFDTGDGHEPAFARRLLPDSVWLSASRKHLTATDAAGVADSDRPDELTTELAAGMTWERDNATTALTLLHTRIDDRRPGYETADSDDISASISQSFSGNAWDIAGHLDAGRYAYKEVHARATEGRIEGGVSLSLQPVHLPDFTAAFDAAFADTDSEIPGDSGRRETWRLNASVDVAKFLPRIVRDTRPYARITYRIENDGDGSQSGSWKNIDHVLFVSAGLRF